MIINVCGSTFTAQSIKWGKTTAIIEIKDGPEISCCAWRIEICYVVIIENLYIGSVISNVSGVVSFSAKSMYVITISTAPYFGDCYCFRTTSIP